MTTGAMIFVAVACGLFVGFLGLLAWADKRTRDLP